MRGVGLIDDGYRDWYGPDDHRNAGKHMLNNIGLPGLLLLLVPGIYLYFAIRRTGQGKLVLKNPYNGHIREAPVGFSWTVFFFGFFPPLFRRDWSGAVIIFLISFVTAGLAHWVFPFIYNKMYLKRLIKDGFKVDSADRDIEQISRSLSFAPPLLSE